MAEDREQYIRDLESIIVNLWYFTPESDKYKLPVDLRARAQEIHRRQQHRPIFSGGTHGEGDDFIGDFTD